MRTSLKKKRKRPFVSSALQPQLFRTAAMVLTISSSSTYSIVAATSSIEVSDGQYVLEKVPHNNRGVKSSFETMKNTRTQRMEHFSIEDSSRQDHQRSLDDFDSDSSSSSSSSSSSKSSFDLYQSCLDFKDIFYGKGSMSQASTLGTSCTCTDNVKSNNAQIFDVTCRDTCEFCQLDDKCALYTLDATITDLDVSGNDYTASYLKECYEFDTNSYDGDILCHEASVIAPGYISRDISINGVECGNTYFTSSEKDGGYYVVNCYNLGYSSYMKIGDDETGLTTTDGQGIFEFYNSYMFDLDAKSTNIKGGCDPNNSLFDLEQVCEDIKDDYFDTLADKLGTKCKCRNKTGSIDGKVFEIACKDTCEFCLSVMSMDTLTYNDKCALYRLKATVSDYDLKTGDYGFTYSQECLLFDDNSFNGVIFCIEWKGQGYDITVNGESCLEVIEEEEEGGSLLVDCSNLGYSSSMKLWNTNIGTTAGTQGQGPFEFYSYDVTSLDEVKLKDGCDPSHASSIMIYFPMTPMVLLSLGVLFVF